MAQPHLGERHPFMVRALVKANLKDVAAQAGYKSVSRWLADLAYREAGCPELQLGPDVRTEDDQLTLLSA